jgi:hypothetical protein
VHFPVAEANSFLGTADQPAVDDNIDIRLDTLQCTECISFWVKTNFAGLPFIQKKLSALKLDTAPEPKKSRVRKRDNCSNSDDSEFEEVTANKTKKKKSNRVDTSVRGTVKSRKTNSPKAKKKTNKEQRQSLLAQMRHTPL